MSISVDPKLIGRWESEAGAAERVTMEFSPDGTLVYTIHEAGKAQKMFLTFFTRDGLIITNQSSKPREDRTKYGFRVGDQLVLDYGGEVSVYVRAD